MFLNEIVKKELLYYYPPVSENGQIPHRWDQQVYKCPTNAKGDRHACN